MCLKEILIPYWFKKKREEISGRNDNKELIFENQSLGKKYGKNIQYKHASSKKLMA